MTVEQEAEGAWKLLALGLGIPAKMQAILLRAFWVSIVSVHIAWVCGWLAWAGFTSPFARAGDLAQLQHTADVSATINLARELRDQYWNLCHSNDPGIRAGLEHYIEQLQAEYIQLTKSRYPEPTCKA